MRHPVTHLVVVAGFIVLLIVQIAIGESGFKIGVNVLMLLSAVLNVSIARNMRKQRSSE